MRKFLAIILLGMATTASAQPTHYRPQRQPQTEERYQEHNKLADVRLDAHRNRAYVQLRHNARRLDYLELRAGRAPINLVDVEVRFADGTTMRTGDRGVVEPFEGRVIDLPRRTSAVVAVIPHYRALGRRDVARLQIFGVPERARWSRR